MNVTYGQATTPEQLAACMKLRYAVYTEEMNLYQTSEAQAAQALTDENDSWGRIYYAEADGEVVATIRANLGVDGRFPDEWNEIWQFDRFTPHCSPDSFMVSSRLTVAKAHRSSTITGRLMSYLLGECIKAGTRLAFLDCVPHLVAFYQRLGARVYADTVEDSDVGILIPMCIVLEDRPHMERVRSAFLPVTRRLLPDALTTPAWVTEVFHTGPYAEAALQQRAEQGLFQLLAENRVPLFAGFAPEDVLKLTQGANLLDTDAGDLMIRRDTVYRSIFVVISGTVDVFAGERRLARLEAGEVLGEMAFLLGSKRSASVHGGPEGASILALQEGVLRKLFETEPALSARFHTNLARVLALRLAGMGQQLSALAEDVPE